VALLGWNLSLRSQVETQGRQVAASREGWQAMIVLMNDPQVHPSTLLGDTAHGSLWTAPGRDVGCLMAQELPAITDDQVYQVWLREGDETASGGVFQARNGNGWVLVRADEPVENYRSVLITVEPSGGSDWPTGPEVLGGELAAVQAQ
jgi:hypothetical protein